MERSEPTLVPEWLKNAGSLAGGSSLSHSDDHAASRIARNKSFMNSNGHDFGRSSSSDRTTSSYFRRSSSSNGSGHLRSYSNFGRNQRGKEWEKDTYDLHDKDKLLLGDRRNRDFSDPLENLSSKFERDGLRRSQSMISAKRGDTWPKKVVTDSSSASANNSGFLTKGSSVSGFKKTTFERDFPSLGVEEKAVVPEVRRIPSPGLSSSIQSLHATSAVIGGEKWTSALAEVPVLVESNGTSSSTSMALGTTTSLNMAEAVAQSPTQNVPQLSVGTQRLEELAIKQSRQLIPVTPSFPKTLVSNPSDKLKTKMGLQQQHPISSSLLVSHSPRGGPVKSDALKASSNVSKLHVLKPIREKTCSTPVLKEKDPVSPTRGSKAVVSTTATLPSSGSAAIRGTPNNPVLDHKPVMTVLEKRPSSQAQSRNDFFNLVRKKAITNSSNTADSATRNSTVPDTGTAVSPSFSDKLAEAEVATAPNTPQPTDAPLSSNLSGPHLSEERHEVTCNGYDNDEKIHPCSDLPISLEEEEAALLRSMGWEENAEEGALTEEEITAFFRDVTKYINSKPTPKILQGVKPKFLPFDSKIGRVGGISSGLSSSDAKLES
ncbi:hypothetical protein ACJIZ3_001118 [Penstemon smallii]|uniref:Uncharacterized protein n=1 Tax=Penstemon smallii TaxID=265156 RepID=A0ABD3U5J2_9LAMI